MENNEFDNVNEQQEVAENSSDSLWILAAIGLGLTTIGLGIKDFFTSRKLQQEREKNKLYQDALRIHQAEINELKSGQERRAYRDRLWEELQAEMEK